ncbi:MAG: hypothetical protein V1744_07025, partial [Candidatus Altiarchaeota archaeon]
MLSNRVLPYILLAGVLVRLLFFVTTPVTGDACFHYSIAKYISTNLKLPTFEYVTGPDPFWWPPLFHVLTAAIYKLTGILTLSPFLFGSIGLVAFYLLCRRHYPDIAETATLILSFLPFHVYYSSIGYVDSLIFLLAVSSYHLYLNYIKSGKGLLYPILTSALCALTHYYGMVVPLSIAAHLFLRERKKALLFIVAVMLLASPAYIKNYLVFGNPIWPKLYGGFYPNSPSVQSLPLSVALRDISNPGRWVGVFFDFWIGAPNSGDDIMDNINVGTSIYPLFTVFLLGWLILITASTLLMVKGVASVKEKRSLILPLLVFLISLLAFALNGLSRMFVAFIPFMVIALALGYNSLKLKYTHYILALALLSFIGGSYAYSYTYMNLRQAYQPFWDMMKAQIPSDAIVIMPFNLGECL